MILYIATLLALLQQWMVSADQFFGNQLKEEQQFLSQAHLQNPVNYTDCISCTAQRYYWLREEECSQYEKLGALSNPRECLEENYQPQKQVTINTTDVGLFDNGVFHMSFSELDNYQCMITINQDLNTQVSFELLNRSSNAKLWIGVGTYEKEAIDNLIYYPRNLTLEEGDTVVILMQDYYNNTRPELEFYLTLKSLEDDCFQCVLNNYIWNENSGCQKFYTQSTIASSFRECVISRLKPSYNTTQLSMRQYVNDTIVATINQTNPWQFTLRNLDGIINRFQFKLRCSSYYHKVLGAYYHPVQSYSEDFSVNYIKCHDTFYLQDNYQETVFYLNTNSYYSTNVTLEYVMIENITCMQCADLYRYPAEYYQNKLCQNKGPQYSYSDCLYWDSWSQTANQTLNISSSGMLGQQLFINGEEQKWLFRFQDNSLKEITFGCDYDVHIYQKSTPYYGEYRQLYCNETYYNATASLQYLFYSPKVSSEVDVFISFDEGEEFEQEREEKN